jgi:thiol-disulfide isomerase/thioredoxin
MGLKPPTKRVIGFTLMSVCVAAANAADAPTPQDALRFTPIQKDVEYTSPAASEVAQCTIRAEKEGGSTAWVVRDRAGSILRRFADTNSDNFVDLWCYYLDGVEVYRDIDSDFNRKADQYRWYQTAGTRWGVDRDEDTKIDTWRVISQHEVAEQLVVALKNADQARFDLLLATSRELSDLGLSSERAAAITKSTKEASSGFRKFAAEQKLVNKQTRYLDFGGSRPGTIPAGTAGSTKDVTVCENASALVQTEGGKPEQIYLGTMVAVGDAWKLIGLPTVSAEGQAPGNLLVGMTSQAPAAMTNAAAPTEEMQRLMADLERLDKQAMSLPDDRLAASVDQRADVLLKLADVTSDAELKDQWYRQLIDMVGAAAQGNDYPQGLDKLEQLRKRLADAGANNELIAHAAFQRMLGEYVAGQQQGNDAKRQEKWLADLEAFVRAYPKASDSAEALLQLGVNAEFIGDTAEAQKWYNQLAGDFSSAPQAVKARGAIARINSKGQPIRLRGKDVQGATVDLSAYRNKVVLIHYWATWCDPCKKDMILLKDFHAKNANKNFDIVGVCLDSSAANVKSFLSQNHFPWKQVLEPGGLDGPLANEMGVMTLPLMILVDQQGNVVSTNIHVAELEGEVGKLIK